MQGPHIVAIFLFLVIAYTINSLFKYLLRKRIIDSGQMDKGALELLLKPIIPSSDPLKWGLLFLFGGLGLVILEFLPYEANNSSLPYGVEAVCLASGFLLYYLLMRRRF